MASAIPLHLKHLSTWGYKDRLPHLDINGTKVKKEAENG
jgi:hypothetical protein